MAQIHDIEEYRSRTTSISVEKTIAIGGGGPHNPSMEERVTRLETHMEYVRGDLSEIKNNQRLTQEALLRLTSATEKLASETGLSEARLSSKMSDLPTKNDLKNYNLQYMAIGFAFLILVVGGIIGGLILIKNN